MKRFNALTYAQKVQWRIRGLWLVLVCMAVYMVAVTELGGGDSRIMTPLAQRVSRLIFFGGAIYIGCRIHSNKKLLQSKRLLQEQMIDERDERNRYLHDKSGGAVVDLLLLLLLFVTLTAALFDMAAFYLSLFLLAATAFLKGAFYFLYSRA